jgi:hypothetical protein
MLTPTISPGCYLVSGSCLAWRIIMACLLAWIPQVARPAQAVESVLSLVGPPARVETPARRPQAHLLQAAQPGKRPQASQVAPSSFQRSSFQRMATKWWTGPLPARTDPTPTTLPPPTVEQTAGLTAEQRMVAEMTVDISLPTGILPRNVAAARTTKAPLHVDGRLIGQWGMTEQRWSATNLQYKPLYFEDVNLERYGYTSCRVMQPLISAARFFATIPALPYKMVLQRPCRPIFALGHHRSGSRVPWHWQRLPLQVRAGLVEAGVVVGLIFLIP